MALPKTRLIVYILRRLLLLAPVLAGLLIIMFILSNIVSDPVNAYITVRTSPAEIEQIRRAHHFDAPVFVQFFYYLVDLSRGDWGLSTSLQYEPVTSIVVRLFPATAELAIVAILIQMALGIPLGVVSALRKDKTLDHGSRLLALSGSSLPVFWLGLIFQYVLFYSLKSANLPYLPSEGRVTYSVLVAHPLQTITGFLLLDSLITGNFAVFQDAITHIIMPAFVLGFAGLGLVTRITRSSMLEVMRQDYITSARAKGLPERIVIYKHALKNAIIPTITIVGLSFGVTLGGAPITETIFSWPGLGNWAASAILNADRAAVLAFALVAATIIVLINLVVDVLYSLADPRVGYA
jgi:ABC-type dipeptide/oligopeptide/nickel transport system permease component